MEPAKHVIRGRPGGRRLVMGGYALRALYFLTRDLINSHLSIAIARCRHDSQRDLAALCAASARRTASPPRELSADNVGGHRANVRLQP
jgi:hypothetical protein